MYRDPGREGAKAESKEQHPPPATAKLHKHGRGGIRAAPPARHRRRRREGDTADVRVLRRPLRANGWLGEEERGEEKWGKGRGAIFDRFPSFWLFFVFFFSANTGTGRRGAGGGGGHKACGRGTRPAARPRRGSRGGLTGPGRSEGSGGGGTPAGRPHLHWRGATGAPEPWKWTFCHLPSRRCHTRVSSDWLVRGRPCASRYCVRRM